jgi:Immunity protein 35
MLTFDETLAVAAEERKRGWAFPYNTKRFAETQNPLDGLLGNGPVFVDRATGEVHALGSARIRAWLEEYDRTGTPPNIRDGWRSGGKGPTPFP